MSPRALPLLLAALLLPALAGAQTFELGPDDHGRVAYESPQHFALELRGGPWYPEVDQEFGAGARGPLFQIFGDEPRVYVGAELDWQVLRIRPLGSLGVGLSMGYASISREAPVTRADGTTDLSSLSGQDTTLTVLPGYAVAVLRLDGLARNTVVPLVPYVKAGIAYSIWWVTTGGHLARRDATSPGVSPTAPPGDLGRAAQGGTLGYQFAAGLMLRLDNFEPRVQRAWDAEMGVNHSYLFVEVARADVNGIGARPQLRLGSTSWVAGIALEF